MAYTLQCISICMFLHKFENILHSHAFIFIVQLSETEFLFYGIWDGKIVYFSTRCRVRTSTNINFLQL